MSKNIDLLAITLVLAGSAILSQAQQFTAFKWEPARLIDLTHRQACPFLAKPFVPRLRVRRG